MRSEPFSDDLKLLWATPLLIRRRHDASALNAKLERLILGLRESEPAAPRTSNYGGWESSGDLFTLESPALDEIRLFFAQAVADCAAEISGNSVTEVEVSLFAWANVLENGAYHAFHTHPDNHFSGIYVVRAGSRDDRNPHSGIICFYEPRVGGAMTRFERLGFGEDFEIAPEEGMLILFPSFLGHSVHPFTGAEERITIAFNARLEAAK